MIGTSILRLIIWGCFRTIGYDFWIWPNLYNDDLPFLDTFKPFYSNERCTDDWLGYILRIVGVFILAALFTWVYTEHIAIMETAEEGFNDAYEWGVNKM